MKVRGYRLGTVLLALAVLCVILPVGGVRAEAAYQYQTFISGLPSAGVVITRYLGDETDLTLPTRLDGHPVIGIGKEVFSGATELESVTVPDEITVIGDKAFANCGDLLVYFKADKSAPVILNTAFANSTVTAFYNVQCWNDSDRSSYGGAVQWIPFAQGTRRETLQADGVTYRCHILNGKATIVRSSDTQGDISLPAALGGYPVTGIEAAYWNCTQLTGVTLPEGLETIGKAAFCGCTSLSGLQIPQSVTSVGQYAFAETAITRMELPAGVTALEVGAFRNCALLEQVTLPAGLTEISGWLFPGCTALKEVDIPRGVTAIRSQAFSDCTALRSLDVPEGVTEIGDMAFQNCTALESVRLPDSLTYLREFTFWGCSSLHTVELPQRLKSIHPFAFAACSRLAWLDIPASVTKIHASAFSDSGLTTLCFEGCVDFVDAEAFKGLTATAVYRPDQWLSQPDPDSGETRTDWRLKDYGGSITWLPVCDEHEWESEPQVDAAPTCTLEGVQSVHCIHGDSRRDVTPLPAAGHSFPQEWRVLKEATEEEEGLAMRRCILCKEQETRVLPRLPLTGDGDGDGALTSTDARLALQLAVDIIDEGELTYPAALDVDRDGDVTSTDARLILQRTVGKITAWP